MNCFRSACMKISVFSQWIDMKTEQRAPDGKSTPFRMKALLQGHLASITTGKSAVSSLEAPSLQVSRVLGC